MDRLGDHLTEAVDSGDVLDRCRHDGVHRSEGGSEGLAVDLADLGNAQTEEQIAERARLGVLDGGLEVLDRLGADAVEFEHLVEVEGVEVSDVGEQAEAHESVDVLLAEVLDIEGVAPDKVLDTTADLAITVEVHTVGGGGGLVTNQPLAAHRTVRGKHPGLRRRVAVGQHRADDLGDHIASPTHDHRVARPDVLRCDLILVVECGGADGDATDEDRVEDRERGGAP